MQFGNTVVLRGVGFHLSMIAGTFTAGRAKAGLVVMFFGACIRVGGGEFFLANLRDVTGYDAGLAVVEESCIAMAVTVV